MAMRLFIYCAGGLGRETYDIAANANCNRAQWSEICFIDDDTTTKGHACGARQFTYTEFTSDCLPDDSRVVIAHGEPRVRRMLADRVRSNNFALGNVVDPTARVSPSARLGDGVIVFPYTYVSSCAIIGDNVLLSVGSGVGHDTVIGDHTVVSSLVSVSGNCLLGSGCYIGTKSCIKENVRVGENTIIGMGSCVFRDIDPEMVALGNPAREIRRNVDHRVFTSSKFCSAGVEYLGQQEDGNSQQPSDRRQ